MEVVTTSGSTWGAGALHVATGGGGAATVVTIAGLGAGTLGVANVFQSDANTTTRPRTTVASVSQKSPRTFDRAAWGRSSRRMAVRFGSSSTTFDVFTMTRSLNDRDASVISAVEQFAEEGFTLLTSVVASEWRERFFARIPTWESFPRRAARR